MNKIDRRDFLKGVAAIPIASCSALAPFTSSLNMELTHIEPAMDVDLRFEGHRADAKKQTFLVWRS